MQLSSRTPRVPVFAYHSQNISGNDYASNDRWSLASDIEAIRASGMRVVSLADFVAWITGELPDDFARHAVVLTSDDAPIFDYEDVEFIELSWDINDLIDKKVDAVHAYMTAQPFIMEQRGIAHSIIRPITYGIDFYGDCLFTTEKEIREHPERVKAFRQASLRGNSLRLLFQNTVQRPHGST